MESCVVCPRHSFGASVRSGRVCPVLGTAGSRCSARRGRSAALLVSLGKRVQRGQKAAHAARTEGKKRQKQPCEQWGQRRARGGHAATEIAVQPMEETRGAGISLQPGERTMQEQSSTLQPLGSTAVEQVGISRRSYGTWRAHAEARGKVWEGRSSRKELVWTNPSPLFSIPSVPLGVGERQGRGRSKAETMKKRAGGEVF